MNDTGTTERFQAYLNCVRDRTVLTMARSNWDSLAVKTQADVLLDAAKTPMKRVSSEASVVATVARQFSPATAEVRIYRNDPQDVPKPVNEDRYTVYIDLPTHSSYPDMVLAASVADSPDLTNCLRKHVFFVKEQPDENHHLPTLPSTVRVLIDRCGI